MQKHPNCAYLRQYIYNTLEARGLKYYISLTPDVGKFTQEEIYREKWYVTTTCKHLFFWRPVVLSFAFAKQLNLFPIDFLKGETLLWCSGVIKCFSFAIASFCLYWTSCSEDMGEVLLSTFNTTIRITGKVILIIPSLILFREQIERYWKGCKTIKHPPPVTSFTSFRWRIKNKAFQIALQYLHFNTGSCWRLCWRNNDCIRAAMMHFWLLFLAAWMLEHCCLLLPFLLKC